MPSACADHGFLSLVWSGAVGELEAGPAKTRAGILMATAAPARFCGRCGAPLAPGATYCGRCGTPAPQRAYTYAPPPPYPTPPQYKLAPAMIAGGLVLILIVTAVVVGAFAAAQFAAGTHVPCTVTCSPKFVTPLPEEASFRSTAYKFQVNYSSDWTVRDHDAYGVTLGTKLGSVVVTGSNGGRPDKVLESAVSNLPSTKWQDVSLVTSLKGAHLGDQDGVGAIYSASLVGSTQTATKVRFAVIAASRGGVTVVVFAVDPADAKNSPNGIPEGQAFDYLCTEFIWG